MDLEELEQNLNGLLLELKDFAKSDRKEKLDVTVLLDTISHLRWGQKAMKLYRKSRKRQLRELDRERRVKAKRRATR